MNRDFIAGLIGLVFAIAYYAMATQIQNSQLADEVGPAGLPKIYAVLLGGFSALLMVRALMLRPAVAGKSRSGAEEWFALRRGLGMLAIGAAYVALVPWLGYPLAIALVIGAASLYGGGQISLRLAVIAALGALGLWFVFVFLLHIGQPAGIWPDVIQGMQR
ncbi:MAG: tripartite tricarboxylate transporter TctB family protein [Hyphomicrobiales bacterium]|nr:tripartite tricarboxylate transporter TctB family protein [Hyphomicrobiales bacterium]